MLKILFTAMLSLSLAAPVLAQSTAANGTIEGTISDSSGGVLPGVTVTIANVDTGVERTVITNERGLYRAPLLPLGKYRVSAELQGFKKFEQTDIALSVGQTVVVNATLAVGTVSETITVSSTDIPALDVARIDIGHTMSDLEVHNLPLVARNPYNFALVQPGVTGIENVEFGVPRLAANGAAMRINYQIDGNTNTEKDRAGLRLLPMSEVMIQEVKVVTTGFAPEFGQTMGMVYNAVTPSGTNTFKGEGSYLFRRKPFSAFPAFFGCTGVAASCGPPAADARRYGDGGCRRADRPQQAVLLRRLGADAPRSVIEQPDHPIGPRSGADARPARTAGRRAERPDGEIRHRQDRLSDQRREPVHRALDSIPQRRALQQRRRHGNDGAGHRFSRRNGFDSRSARQLGRHRQAERIPFPVRASSSELDRELGFWHRAGDHDQQSQHLVWRALGQHRPGKRGVRLQAEHHAGHRQPDLHSRRAQLQVRIRLAAHLRRADRGAAVFLYVSDRRRLPGRPRRRRAVRLHVRVANHG
jgi:hypothetical protein